MNESNQVKAARELSRAAKKRQRMLDEFTHVVLRCKCAWPIKTYRNGHGHAPTCPIATEVRFDDSDEDS